MQAFEYAAPSTKEQAIQALGASWGETEVLAGGTDLLSMMKEHLSTPRRVVDIKGIQELRGITPQAGGLRIGALVTLEQLASSAAVDRKSTRLNSSHRL